jgi:cysteine desulfurase / selenocysteine lyase
MTHLAQSLFKNSTPTLLQTLDVHRIRQDFPILHQNINGYPLIYLDNAATTHKPQAVINTISQFYEKDNSNVHRGVHTLSERATKALEQTRTTIQHFIHAKESREIIFVRGTTEAINLVAQSYGRSQLQQDDEILISAMEHHSNIVPWQLLCQQIGTKLRIIPINDAGELIIDEYQKMLNPRTKLIAIVHLSNALGTINPIKQMIELAHAHNIPVLVDGAQAISHLPVDVQALDCDFYAFSAHKLYGPTGIGVLYGKVKHLEKMPPYQGGGDMISKVSFEETLFNELPYKFEAGTPDIAGVIGLGAAIDYVKTIGLASIAAHEEQLLDYATQKALTIPELQLIGTAPQKASILSFIMKGIHPHDIGTILNHHGIAIRSGHHCAMPLMQRFNVAATARASFGMYNTFDEIDNFINALQEVKKVFC